MGGCWRVALAPHRLLIADCNMSDHLAVPLYVPGAELPSGWLCARPPARSLLSGACWCCWRLHCCRALLMTQCQLCGLAWAEAVQSWQHSMAQHGTASAMISKPNPNPFIFFQTLHVVGCPLSHLPAMAEAVYRGCGVVATGLCVGGDWSCCDTCTLGGGLCH